MAIAPVPQPRVLSVMPTFQCTAACKHCGTMSSPRVKTRLPTEVMMQVIREVAENGFGLVVFTGGEPTLVGDALLDAIRLSRDLGMLTRVVTNCHWAASNECSNQYVSSLRDSGLDEINFSTGDQHARFVPIESVLRAIRSAVEYSYVPSVMVETVAARKITKESIESHPYHRATLELFPGCIVRVSESPWMPLMPKRLANYPPGMATDHTNLASCSGCDSVLQTTTIQADGAIGACCGLGMRLIPELQLGIVGEVPLASAIEDAEEDLLKRWIRAEGPERILAWAAERDPSIEWEGMYAHRCQACLRLYKDPSVRKIVREHYKEKIPDVLYSEWLLYHYQAESFAQSSDTEDDRESSSGC
jgi:organic radical activating enzyme